MKKLLVMLLCLALCLPAFAAAEQQVLNVLSWEGYVDADTLYNFEQETGIKVIWSPMDSIDNMLLKVTEGGGADFDLILSSDYSLDILRKQGLLQKVDKSKLSNYANLDPNFLGQQYDPDDEYVIPYVAGSILLIYEVQALKRAWAQRAWGNTVLWGLALAASLVGVYGFIEYILYVSYGFWGVLIPVFTALPDHKEGEAPSCFRPLSGLPQKLAFCALGMLLLCLSRGLTTNIQSYCLLSIPLLALYNGRPGVRGLKYGFYAFYPLHLVVIFLLEMAIRGR